jgi:hypothetical protein
MQLMAGSLQQLLLDGPITVRLEGDCMHPEIPRGALIRLERRKRYRSGDAVTLLRADSSMVTHRFLGSIPGRSGSLMLTRADDATSCDPPVRMDRILGRVTRVDGARYRPALKVRAQARAAWCMGAMKWLAAALSRRIRRSDAVRFGG